MPSKFGFNEPGETRKEADASGSLCASARHSNCSRGWMMKYGIAGIVLLGLFVSCKEEEGSNAQDAGLFDASPDANGCCPTGAPMDPFLGGGSPDKDGQCPKYPLEAAHPRGMICTAATSHSTDKNGCDTVNYYLDCVRGDPDGGFRSDASDASRSDASDAASNAQEGGAEDAGEPDAD